MGWFMMFTTNPDFTYNNQKPIAESKYYPAHSAIGSEPYRLPWAVIFSR